MKEYPAAVLYFLYICWAYTCFLLGMALFTVIFKLLFQVLIYTILSTSHVKQCCLDIYKRYIRYVGFNYRYMYTYIRILICMSSRYWLKQLVRQIGELSLILIYSVVSHFKVILHNHEYLNFAVNFSFSLRNFIWI